MLQNRPLSEHIQRISNNKKKEDDTELWVRLFCLHYFSSFSDSDGFILNDHVIMLFYFCLMLFSSTNTTTVGVATRRRTVDRKRSTAVSEFRRALPQFCVVGVKNLILLGKVMKKKYRKKLRKLFRVIN